MAGAGAPVFLSVCFAGTGDEAALRRYAEAHESSKDEEEEAVWWRRVHSGQAAWSSLRGAVASLRCEVRTIVPTGSNITVIAEVSAVHEGHEHGELGSPVHALLYQADQGYFPAAP